MTSATGGEAVSALAVHFAQIVVAVYRPRDTATDDKQESASGGER